MSEHQPGEGDVLKHLSLLGCSFLHVQSAIDEYNFQVRYQTRILLSNRRSTLDPKLYFAALFDSSPALIVQFQILVKPSGQSQKQHKRAPVEFRGGSNPTFGWVWWRTPPKIDGQTDAGWSTQVGNVVADLKDGVVASRLVEILFSQALSPLEILDSSGERFGRVFFFITLTPRVE
jgi:hypothetical protein